MEKTPDTLPVAAVLPRLIAALKNASSAVLTSPPGSGKTTLVPHALLDLTDRKILLLEPRRMAAKLAAEFLAARIGEAVGKSVGYRVRGESACAPETRIEVVTEGVLLRLIQQDPALTEYGAVIFDEFHERNLTGDMALAFTLDAQDALRPDLKLLLMSATIDTAALSRFLGGVPVLDAPGRVWPLELRYSENAVPFNDRAWRKAFAALILRAAGETEGDVLAFLPGAGEIDDCARMLESAFDATVRVERLYGALPLSEQLSAVRPAPAGIRKIVLATNIAESSVTIPGVRVVVDSGLEKNIRMERDSGVGTLELGRISQASARQRAGRAGRLGPGTVYTLYTRNEFRNMPEFAPPEIRTADLTQLVLEAAVWGAPVNQLRFPDPPPEAALAAAAKTLCSLGLLDADGRVTERGRAVHRLSAPARQGVLLLTAQENGCPELGCSLAALTGIRVRLPFPDLAGQLAELRRRPTAEFRREERIYRDLMRCNSRSGTHADDAGQIGLLIASAFPEFVGRQRERHGRVYLLRCGHEAVLPPDSDLAGREFLAVAALDGGTGIVRGAAGLEPEALEQLFGAQTTVRTERLVDWETARTRVEEVRELGAITLSRTRRTATEEESAAGVCDALRRKGLSFLNWSRAAQLLLERVRFAQRCDGNDWPDWSEAELLNTLESWLMPNAPGARGFSDLGGVDLFNVLAAALGYEKLHRLDRDFPTAFTTPAGASHPIDYSGEVPQLSVRLGELYGLDVHPTVGRRRLPLRLELLSPAQRPVQVTGDLPGFWRGSYALVRKEMKSRYPKHLWPEDPIHTAPTLRAKPRS